MARRPGTILGGLACHVTMRDSGNLVLFEDDAAFLHVLAETRVGDRTRTPRMASDPLSAPSKNAAEK